MKVYIGNYPNWYSTYNFENWLLEKLHKKYHWDIEEKDYTRLDKIIVWCCDKWQKVLNVTINKLFQKRTVKIRIDKYDTWNMNDTLAMIILPMLKQLKETKHGSPMVDLEDVPEELRGHGTAEDGDYQLHLDFGEEAKNVFEEAAWGALHTRWDWVLNEMIWTFSQLNTDWEEPFHYGVTDITFEHIEEIGRAHV